MAFGLEDPPVLDRAELADRAIGRAEHRAGLLGQRAGAILQGAGEEGIEMFIGLQVLDLRFAHIDLVAPGEPGDQAVLNQVARQSAAKPISRDSRWCGSRYWLQMNRRSLNDIPQTSTGVSGWLPHSDQEPA